MTREAHTAFQSFANQSLLVIHGLSEALCDAGIPTSGSQELVQMWGCDGVVEGAELGNATY